MTWLDLAEWHCTVEVCSFSPFVDFTADSTFYSCLWSSRHDLVQVPAEQGRPSQQEPRNRCQSCCRSDCLCQHQPVCLPQQHGHHGGFQSKGEVGQELLDRPDNELDGLALCTGYQFQVGSSTSPSPGCQRYLVGLELLLELLEQRVRGRLAYGYSVSL